MTIVPVNYPEVKLNKKQFAPIRMELVKRFLLGEGELFPQFTGYYLERGAFVLTLANEWKKDWLCATV